MTRFLELVETHGSILPVFTNGKLYPTSPLPMTRLFISSWTTFVRQLFSSLNLRLPSKHPLPPFPTRPPIQPHTRLSIFIQRLTTQPLSSRRYIVDCGGI
ncbi:hypothetical protein L1987_03667 [Smallanthus sonchifolius]|uniref:Uncharacterized protein n=1 Tax=Smallanthus sonchifolius TaxID=185202 RepID=A0ACB9KBC5_9ASTR|nr:hypothetical protein L1987_03667 [Smallanthus sonchifolius]